VLCRLVSVFQCCRLSRQTELGSTVCSAAPHSASDLSLLSRSICPALAGNKVCFGRSQLKTRSRLAIEGKILAIVLVSQSRPHAMIRGMINVDWVEFSAYAILAVLTVLAIFIVFSGVPI
jgi:hypothetical protein